MSGGTFCWLILQEGRRLLLTRWVGGAAVLLCASSAFSVALGVRDLQEHTVSYQKMLQQRVEAQVRGTGRVLGRAAEPGLRVIRPPTPGAVLTAGVEPTLPAAWEFTPAGTEVLATYDRNEVRIDGRGVGDLTEIIAVLGGLLAVWLGVSTVVSDRTAGRTAALRTLPVAPETMAIVRLAGGILALGIVVAVWCTAVGLNVRLFQPTGMAILPLMPVWMAAPALCYLALMFALGTAVGARAREGLSALVTAVSLWLAIVFVVPQVNQLITRSVIEVPPRTRMEVERREHMADAALVLEHEIGDAMVTLWPDVMRPTNAQQSDAYVAVGEPIWRAGLARIRDAARVEERHWLDERARADRITRWLDGLSPSSWLLETMAELAGTGRSTQAGWTRAISAHDQALDEHLFANRPKANARVLWKGQAVAMAFDRHPAPRYSELPKFTPPQAHPGTWTVAAARSLAGLAAYTAIVMAAAYVWLRSR